MNQDTFSEINHHALATVIGGAAATRVSASAPDPKLKSMLTEIKSAIESMANQKPDSSSMMLPMMMMMMKKR